MLDQGEGILEPIEQEPPEEYSAELGNQGTIVIWDKIDSATTEKDLEDIKHDIGRIYRKFLTDTKVEDGKVVKNQPISLTINELDVPPYDPLYVTFKLCCFSFPPVLDLTAIDNVTTSSPDSKAINQFCFDLPPELTYDFFPHKIKIFSSFLFLRKFAKSCSEDKEKLCIIYSINSFFILTRLFGLDKLSSEPIDINTSKKLGPLELRNFFIVEFIFFVCEILKYFL